MLFLTRSEFDRYARFNSWGSARETFNFDDMCDVEIPTDLEKLLPEYLMLFLTRSEFDRYARFNSWGSARETFNFDDMCDVEIPIPDIKVQKAISDIYAVYVDRKQINNHLKERIKSMCPILIKGSLEEAGA